MKGKIDISSSYDSRINGMEHSLAARGDIWRLEASSSSSTTSDGTSSETRLSSRRRRVSVRLETRLSWCIRFPNSFDSDFQILGYLPTIRSNLFRLFHHHFTDFDSEV